MLETDKEIEEEAAWMRWQLTVWTAAVGVSGEGVRRQWTAAVGMSEEGAKLRQWAVCFEIFHISYPIFGMSEPHFPSTHCVPVSNGITSHHLVVNCLP